MNIAITTLVTPAVHNGLSKYIRFLIQGLQQIESTHQYYVIVNKKFDEFLDIDHPRFQKVIVDIPHYPRSIMRPRYFLWQNLQAGKLFEKYNIDLFHLPNPVPLFNTFSVPHVVTIHDMAEYVGHRHSTGHRLFRRLAIRTSSNKASEIVTVSEFSKAEILRFLGEPPEKIHVTHPGLTLNLSLADGMKPDFPTPYLLHVGGGRPNKNVERTIDAFRRLESEANIKLLLLGASEGLGYSQEKIKQLQGEGIFVKGYVSDKELVGYYKQALGLVYPSLYEGFGLPLMEAMALGIPVITSDRASMPEVAGDAALYIDPENVDSIRNAMEKLAHNEQLRQELSAKGHRRVKQFDWKQTARQTLVAYDRAAGKRA